MRDRIVGLLEKVDLAVAESEGVIDPDAIDRMAQIRNDISARLAYRDDVVLAGLVGGTGSGKSSLCNAITGSEAAQVGGIRPTTTAPLAVVAGRHADSLAGFLARLGVEQVATVSSVPWLCILDLPDTDSVVMENRATVDRILPFLDLVIWVLDPEKYRDENTHRQIAEIAGHADRFIFVLNQVDKIDSRHHEALADDLKAALVDDGIAAPGILLTSANPPAGPVLGVDALVDELAKEASDPSRLYQKLLLDLRGGVDALLAESSGGQSLRFEERWESVMERVRNAVEGGRTSEAAHAVSSFVADIAHEGGNFLGQAVTPSSIDFGELLEHEGGDIDSVAAALEDQVANPIRALVYRRARSNALMADLALAVESMTG